MRTLIVLPQSEIDQQDAARAIHLSTRRLGPHGPVDVAAPPESAAFYRSQLTGHAVGSFDAAAGNTGHDTFVFVEGYSGDCAAPGPHAFAPPRSAAPRVYWFMNGARLKLVQPAQYDTFEFPFIDSHVFQRLSGRRHEFVNFPYGRIYSDVEVGPVNELGFRVPTDYRRLANRDAAHKLVVVFGGSAAFSYYCDVDEMFSTRLELRLNATLAARGSGVHVTALNFGMHDDVVMQEMLTYMLFVQELRPDVVIAHDGHNDLYYGLQGDPYLLHHFDVIYQRYSEEWSKILHGTGGVATPPLYSTAVAGQELNFPHDLLRVYLTRKRQFERMVRGDGGRFVWGVQPLHCSKRALSARELVKWRQAERGVPRSPELERFSRRLYQAYGLLSAALAAEPGIQLVDFNRRFQEYDERFELLWDHCHTSPEGDEVVAAAYHDAIIDLIDRR